MGKSFCPPGRDFILKPFAGNALQLFGFFKINDIGEGGENTSFGAF
jgi:hypothetical protein